MHYITWSFGPDAKFIDISNSIYNKIRARMPSGSLWLGFRKSKQRWTHFQIRVPSPVQMFLTALNKSLCNPIPPSIPLEEFFHFPEAMRRGLAGSNLEHVRGTLNRNALCAAKLFHLRKTGPRQLCRKPARCSCTFNLFQLRAVVLFMRYSFLELCKIHGFKLISV